VSSFKQSVVEKKKSLLLAVCRDSASEGVNLPSACARLVIVTSIPYPSYFSAFIRAKRQFDEAVQVSIARCATGRRRIVLTMRKTTTGQARSTGIL